MIIYFILKDPSYKTGPDTALHPVEHSPTMAGFLAQAVSVRAVKYLQNTLA